jgi:hypothetical protein
MKNETSQIGCGQRLAGIMRLAAEESAIRFVSQSLVFAAICCMLTAPAGAASIETVQQVQRAIDENRTKLVLPDGMELRGIATETNTASHSVGDVVVRTARNQQQAELRFRFLLRPRRRKSGSRTRYRWPSTRPQENSSFYGWASPPSQKSPRCSAKSRAPDVSFEPDNRPHYLLLAAVE